MISREMKRLDGKRYVAEEKDVRDWDWEEAAQRVFRNVDLPGLLEETGLNVVEISIKTGLSRAKIIDIIRKGGGEPGRWAVGLRVPTVSKLLALVGLEWWAVTGPIGGDVGSGRLYLGGEKWQNLSPEYGPVTISATAAHFKTVRMVNRKAVRMEFPTVAHAYFAQKYLPDWWHVAQRYQDLGRLIQRIGQDPPEWKMGGGFARGYALKTAYYSVFNQAPELRQRLLGTGQRELVWECPKRHHERYHELGDCPKCGQGQGNLAGQILMELREELVAGGWDS